MYVCALISIDSKSLSVSDPRPTYVYLPILEPYLQVVIDSLIRDLADESEIRYSDLLLLGALEYSFPDLGLPPSTTPCLGRAAVLLPSCAFCNCLIKHQVSVFRSLGYPYELHVPL